MILTAVGRAPHLPRTDVCGLANEPMHRGIELPQRAERNAEGRCQSAYVSTGDLTSLLPHPGQP